MKHSYIFAFLFVAFTTTAQAEPRLSLEDQYEMLTAKEQKILEQMKRGDTRPTQDEEENLPDDAVRAQLEESNERLAALEERIMNLLAVAEADGAEREVAPQEVAAKIELPENSILHFGDIEIKKDMPIATITKLGGNMYSRSADPDSLMTSLAPGSMLAIELRLGEWYRVVTPYGERGWVKSSDLLFGATPRSYPTETIQIRGFIR